MISPPVEDSIEDVYRLLCAAQSQAAQDEEDLRRLRHEVSVVTHDVESRREQCVCLQSERDNIQQLLPHLKKDLAQRQAQLTEAERRRAELLRSLADAHGSLLISAERVEDEMKAARLLWRDGQQAVGEARGRALQDGAVELADMGAEIAVILQETEVLQGERDHLLGVRLQQLRAALQRSALPRPSVSRAPPPLGHPQFTSARHTLFTSKR